MPTTRGNQSPERLRETYRELSPVERLRLALRLSRIQVRLRELGRRTRG